ncbi:S8 family serine peptidase [Demequina sp. SYSU T00192]|uniref:S8 family serine peptidase n=1 Tax=Demequina litoralis TaxID=3051660 RepID=A0ABT8GBZ5_9MICO|nr:S8 family serine peptidase [Demequina sp. SYSU T00192]MDN4476658.1 S8 family serine peptidase [Demequina sp. SYSU T00192]
MSLPLIPRRGASRVAAGAATAVLGCALLVPAPAFAAKRADASDVLAATTAAERQALAHAIQLTEPDEVHVDSSVDLTSTEPADVIVLLRQPVAATAQALAAEAGTALSAKDAKAAVKASQARFADFAKAQGLAKGITTAYTEALNAVALTATGTEIASLLDSADVAGVWPNEVLTLDLPEETEAGTTVTGGGTTYDEVAALHDAGITGEGVKVGVLDTGIDYRHPAIADVYVGGWDAVDGDDDPMETTYADWKASGMPEKYSGSPYYTSHGTHVSGIIAGQDASFGGNSAWGVAPDVELYGYRVLGPYGSGSTEDILEGMERALVDGMDVVNMSLGGSYNDHQSALSLAADNLTLAGVTTVIAAGNDGANGAATLGSPGTSALAITVGANDSSITLAATEAAVGEAEASLRLVARQRDEASVTDLAGQTLPIVDVGDGTSSGYIGKRPQGAIVLIERGGTTFTSMVTYALQRGAAGVLVSNDRDGYIEYYLGENDAYAPAFGMTQADGAALRTALAAGATEVTFGDMGTITTDGDALADFSSRGPSNGTTDIKPELTAPGVSTMSSVPTWDIDPKGDVAYADAYGRKSGTSMATPFVAGVVALMLGEDPSLTPADVKTRLMNTADDLRDDSGVFESGAGQVDPRQAVHGTTDAQVIDALWAAEATHGSSDTVDDITGALSLGMLPATSSSTVTRDIEITNRSASSQTYTLALDTANGAGTADFDASGIEVSFPSRVKVSPGSTRHIKVVVDVPAGTPTGTYGAFVEIAQAAEEALRLPLGLRVDDAAFTDFTMLKPVMSTAENVYDPAAKFSLGVATPTRTIDLFVVDAATGEDVGYVGGLSATLMKDGLRYGAFAWYGEYLPLTGDKDFPIGHMPEVVEPGLHTLRVVGTDDSGTTFEATNHVYVDNTAPVFTTSLDDADVYEFANGQSTFELTGSLVDGDTEAIRAAGIDIDESDNAIQMFSTTITPYKTMHPEADGSFTTDVSLFWSPVQSHRFLGMDAAGNIGELVQSMWFKDTQAYVLGRASSTEARAGDEITMSFSTNKADMFGTMTLEVLYNPRDTTILDITEQEAFAAYGRISGEITDVAMGSSYRKLRVPITFDGATEYTGDDLPLIDVAFEMPDTIAAETTGFLTVSTYVQRTDGRYVSMQRHFDIVEALAPTTTVTGGYYAQGLLTAAGYIDTERDYSAVGATATLTSPEGDVLPLSVGADGTIGRGGLTLFDEEWQLEVTLPGHLAWHQPLTLSRTAEDGEAAGTIVSIAPQLAAGDVNGDDVVDILDAVAIRDAAGTADRAADINADGTVDAADLAFVESNFLVRNPTVADVPTPQTKYKGVTLDQVLATFAS